MHLVCCMKLKTESMFLDQCTNDEAVEFQFKDVPASIVFSLIFQV